jgi:hypothetical protein
VACFPNLKTSLACDRNSLESIKVQKILLVLLLFIVCCFFQTGGLKAGELIEDFSNTLPQVPIKRAKHPWSNPSGQSWSFDQDSEGTIALISSPNATDELRNEGRLHFSLIEAPTPIGKISFQLTIDQIGVITEAMRRRPPRLLISLLKRAGGDVSEERAAAVSVSLPRASEDLAMLELLDVVLAVDRGGDSPEMDDRRTSIPVPSSFMAKQTLDIEFSEDGSKARLSIEGSGSTDWLELAFPVSEIGYLRISQLGLRVKIHEIRVQEL